MKKLTAGIFATILGLTTIDAFAAVPSKGYVDTALAGKQDVLTAGANITIEENAEGKLEISSSYVDTNTTYKAGTNISIAEDGTISATDTNTTYTAGDGITLDGTTFKADVASVSAGTSNVTVTNTEGAVSISVTDSDVAAGATDGTTTGKYALTKIVGEGGVVSYGWELIDRDYVSTDVTPNGQ